MSPAGRDCHDDDYRDLVSLYALQALPEREVSALDAHLAACADCRSEMEALRPIVAAFVAWPTDLLRPSVSLWDRLTRRIAGETGQAPVVPVPQRAAEVEWEAMAAGVWVKLLATDTTTDRVSMLVRLAPGAAYPPHRHAGVEELYLIDGELIIDARKLSPGDYNRGEPGEYDRRVWSETGCTCVLLTSTRDVLLR